MRALLGMARFAAFASLVALAGCVTAENSLSQNDIASMKLTGVAVAFAPDARIQWEDGIRAYAVSKAISDDEIANAVNTPEAKAYVQNLLRSKVKARIERKMAGQLNGSRPVRLDVVVQSFTISSAVQRIVIGGGYGMVADANLVDVRTGKVVVAHPRLVAALVAGNGIVGTAVQAAIDNSLEASPAERVADHYGDRYRSWLNKS